MAGNVAVGDALIASTVEPRMNGLTGSEWCDNADCLVPVVHYCMCVYICIYITLMHTHNTVHNCPVSTITLKAIINWNLINFR